MEHCRKYFSHNLRGKFVSDIHSLQDEVPFEIRLAETIAWCQQCVRIEDPRKSLRSFDLTPHILAGNREWIVSSLLWARKGALSEKAKELSPVTKPDHLAGGKLLAYFPDEQVHDGASEAASKGLLDEYDSPPWDTWTGIFTEASHHSPEWTRTYVVSWVPPEFISLAEEGIVVNPVDCIAWLENADVPLNRKLREKGLIS
jgi:hypothetical protein